MNSNFQVSSSEGKIGTKLKKSLKNAKYVTNSQMTHAKYVTNSQMTRISFSEHGF